MNFFPIHIQPFTMTKTQETKILGFENLHEWIWGDVYELGKVS